MSGDQVERVNLFQSPWVLWCSPEHPLAARKVLRWRDLKDHALVAAGRDHERNVAQMGQGLAEEERIVVAVPGDRGDLRGWSAPQHDTAVSVAREQHVEARLHAPMIAL